MRGPALRLNQMARRAFRRLACLAAPAAGTQMAATLRSSICSRVAPDRGAPGTRVRCVTRPHSIKQCSHVHIPARHSRKHHAGRGDRVVASGDKFSGLVRDRSSLRTDGGNDRYLLAREEARRRCKHIKAAQVTHRGRLVRQRPSQPPQHRSAALCAVQCVHGARQFPEGSLAHSRIGQSVQQGHQVGQGFGSIAGTREVLGKLRIRLLESMDRLQSDKMQA